MARLGQAEEEIEEVTTEVEKETVEVKAVQEEPLPDNVVTLSSGIKVQFHGKLPSGIAQQIVVTTFSDANLQEDGTVNDDLTSIEQLKLAKKMFNYNHTIISFGTMYDLLNLYDKLPRNSKWMRALALNPMIIEAHPKLDLTEQTDIEFVYLCYFVFRNQEDWDLLSNQLLDSAA